MEAEEALQLAKETLAVPRRVAVLGASREPEKYGHEVFAVLRDAGHTVWPVNPKVAELAGAPCYPSLEALPGEPEVIVLALAPAVTAAVAPGCAGRGAVVWLPPGCYEEATAAALRATGTAVVAGLCPVFVTRSLQAGKE